MEAVERIADAGQLLALIIRTAADPRETTFVTPPDAQFQLGFVVYPANSEIRRHDHRPLERHIVGTSEALFVRSGSCDVDIYDDARSLVATRRLNAGDVLLMLAGGHGFRLLEDTTLLEIKQGPYTGLEEKERF